MLILIQVLLFLLALFTSMVQRRMLMRIISDTNQRMQPTPTPRGYILRILSQVDLPTH